MSSLPPPPPAPAPNADQPSAGRRGQPPDGTRPGDVTMFWRAMLTAAWMAAFFAYAAVWQASVQIGIATWWVGPRSQPAPTFVRLLPFLATLAMILLIVYNVRGLSRLAVAAPIFTVVIALPDFSRSVGLAVVEVIISGALLVVGVSAHLGRYRAVVPTDAGETPSASVPPGAAANAAAVGVTTDLAPPQPPGTHS